MTIKQLFINKKPQHIEISGWVTSNHGNNEIYFVKINDGSTIDDLQLVIKKDLDEIKKIRLGSSLKISGKLVLTPERNQLFEVQVESYQILKQAAEDYPIQKNQINLETLREKPHIRHRTKIFRAIMRIRSTLALEIHNFFQKNNFLYMHTPIITSNDGEGAGETFTIFSEENKNFFNKVAHLGVTGQLHAEAYALGFNKVYTFGPTFRAENSHTPRHAAEFWMIEPEVAFFDLPKIIDLASKMLKEVIKNTINNLKPEFEFLNKRHNLKLLPKLQKFLNQELKIIEYKDALIELKKAKQNFEHQNLEFGVDLAIEHEKYLCEIFDQPIAVINYPKSIKAFYMYQNDDQKTVAAFDLLVPGVGELIGGSQRETDYQKLKTRISELNLNFKDLEWYLDLRRFGDSMSSGFGIGFERLVMYVTGIENIRDSIPFPRTASNLKM